MKSNTIANCIRKDGFPHAAVEGLEENEKIVPTIEIWEDVNRETGVWNLDIVQMANKLAVCRELTDTEILGDVMNIQTVALSSDEEEPEHMER